MPAAPRRACSVVPAWAAVSPRPGRAAPRMPTWRQLAPHSPGVWRPRLPQVCAPRPHDESQLPTHVLSYHWLGVKLLHLAATLMAHPQGAVSGRERAVHTAGKAPCLVLMSAAPPGSEGGTHAAGRRCASGARRCGLQAWKLEAPAAAGLPAPRPRASSLPATLHGAAVCLPCLQAAQAAFGAKGVKLCLDSLRTLPPVAVLVTDKDPERCAAAGAGAHHPRMGLGPAGLAAAPLGLLCIERL